MHEYNKPFVLEEVQIPKNISGESVLVKVGGAGICRKDLQIIDGYFKEYLPLKLSATLGHEIAGWVEEVGSSVPESLFEKGDLVVVSGGWGCGLCPECKRGDDQICGNGRWLGFGEYGGYSEFVPIPSYRYLIKIDKKYNLKPEELALLIDAGVTII
jgi:alcohol dehydrogenase, propanol-preferring